MKVPDTADPIINYVNTLCDEIREDPLEEEVVLAIIEQTGLVLKTTTQELGRHLSNLSIQVYYRHEAPKYMKREAESRKALSSLQKLIASLSGALDTLSQPDSPLFRALSKAATIAMLAEDPKNVQLLEALVASKRDGSFNRKLRDEIEVVRNAIAPMSKYTNQTLLKEVPPKSIAQWNTICVGEILPALFEHHFGRPFGISNHPIKGEPTGPGVRFLAATSDAICIRGSNGEPYSPSTLVGYWRSAKRNPLPKSAWVDTAILDYDSHKLYNM